MKEELETHKITPAMKKFFARLLEIKKFAKAKAKDYDSDPDWKVIHVKLDELIHPQEMPK